MPVWRCPHCGIPQPETARCWVCHRSTTSCGTCRHFRRGIAAGLGLCGLDVRRLAVGPAEVRPCWTPTATEPMVEIPESQASGAAPPLERMPAANTLGSRPGRTFVPVDELASGDGHEITDQGASLRRERSAEIRSAALPEPHDHPAASPMAAVAPRWSLWGDVEG